LIPIKGRKRIFPDDFVEWAAPRVVPGPPLGTFGKDSEMTKADDEKLHHVRLELARDHEFPNGSNRHGYEFIAPLDDHGQLDLDVYKRLKDRARVRRFWGSDPEEVGHILHKRGGTWAFHYDIHGDAAHDEAGFRFDTHKFVPGEYVSLKEQDGTLRTFRVTKVGPVE
jgi:hypothetical protein